MKSCKLKDGSEDDDDSENFDGQKRSNDTYASTNEWGQSKKQLDGPRTYDYSYDASRQKWKQVYTIGSVTETTYFAGRIFPHAGAQ